MIKQLVNAVKKAVSDTQEFNDQLKELKEANKENKQRGYPDGSPAYFDHSGSFVLPDPMLEDFTDPTRIPIDFSKHGYMGWQGYNGVTGSLGVGNWADESPKPGIALTEDLVDQLWKKMYERPVIVRCSHCNSHNVISNPTCIQCGAPMGDYKEMVRYGG
jgi:hypothetical protein